MQRPDDGDPAVLLDIDGTLVDTAYHHALAWSRAFAEHDLRPPVWQLHRHVGMGGDRFVAAVADEDVERRLGDALRERWQALFEELLPEIVPLDGAPALLDALRGSGRRAILASSAVRDHVDAFLGILGSAGWEERVVCKDDVDASKPDPDLVQVALERTGAGTDAVMVGDTPWDAIAAGRAGIPFLGLLTGGFAECELRRAGAVEVFEELVDLQRHLGL